jgi:hypothetical protein
MFETLHHVEVALRNAIDAQFEPVLASAEPPAMWLCDPAILNERSLQLVDEPIARIKQERHMPTRGRVVAGLTFGFWRALFDKRYDRLWVSHLHKAFPHGSGDRAQIAGLMARLGPFRNRVAHHETIIRTPLADRHEDMLMLVETIDPEAREWIEGVQASPASRRPSIVRERRNSAARPRNRTRPRPKQAVEPNPTIRPD